jgi:protein-S-isoprenylcysteine O-methyltransferase Ste14
MFAPVGTIFGFDARDLFGALIALFWVSEWLLFARLQPGREDRNADRGSGRWLAVAFPLAWASAFALVHVRQADFGGEATFRAGLALLVMGQVLRWWSMATLGRLFTVYVAIRDGHRVVQSGPYRLIRHPSYTAILLVHLGAALCLGNALSAVALLVPVSLALGYRMRVEEAALIEALGPEYSEYMTRTKRLVPGLY